jgi:hypothetical protein
MTLDDAIRHELWCARESQGETAKEHMQMAEWLCELRRLRELVEDAVEAASLDDVRDWPIGHRLRLIRQARELGIEVDDGDSI